MIKMSRSSIGRYALIPCRYVTTLEPPQIPG